MNLDPTSFGKDIFERLLTWIGKLRVRGENVSLLEQDVLNLERKLHFLDNKRIATTVQQRLTYWFSLIPNTEITKTRNLKLNESFGSGKLSAADLHQRIRNILLLLHKAVESEDEIRSLIDELKKLQPVPLINYNNDSFNKQFSPQEFYEYKGIKSNINFLNFESSWQEAYEAYKFQWEIFIQFFGDHYPATQISKLIWVLSGALESISGVVVEFDSVGTGNVWFRLSVFIKNLAKKDEVKNLLESTRQAIILGQLDEGIEEASQLREDGGKTEAKKIDLARRTEAPPKDRETQKLKDRPLQEIDLAVRVREADIRPQELESYQKMLELVHQMAYIMKEGLLTVAPVEIKINGQLYLSCEDAEFLPGVEMQIIDEKGR